jgi:hypothetical protein
MMNDRRVRNRIVSLADVAAQAPNVYHLLNRLGAQRRRRRAAQTARSIGWFGAGIAVGTGLAALFAPNSGAETRRRLSVRARRVRDYVAPSGNGAAREERV